MKYFFFYSLVAILGCGQSSVKQTYQTDVNSPKMQTGKAEIQPAGNTIETRFLPPDGFLRTDVTNNSFQQYLRSLPLKTHGSVVMIYDGRTKQNYNVYDAVVDLEIGTKDLHQCADALMRLRAEYLFNQGQYDKIHFNFTNGFRVDYSEWIQGKRIKVDGNRTWWVQSSHASNTYSDFWKYMEIIFSYAGTQSLSKEMEAASIDNMNIGDVFIQGGSPGHAIIVVDMAVDQNNGKKIFLLAQSYMPAQELQVLKNPNDAKLSPWYSVDFGEVLQTPEWTFRKIDLKRFKEE